ncbi:MAG: zinc ribbon domain-containing protein [Clostridiales bacterium]|jgi:hypothetical protein|nr:zinc ribbon domain-containing protein [Clostridiales bacterium]
MGFLDRIVKTTVEKAVSRGVEKGVERVVVPKAEQAAANAAEKATDAVFGASGAATQTGAGSADSSASAAALGGAFAKWQGAAMSYANEAAKDLKICPECGEGASAETRFCPKCGGALPEQTLGQSAVCPKCGKQNNVGVRFCADCGGELPVVEAERQAAKAKNEAALAKWDALLPQYPKWRFGGGLEIDESGYDENGKPCYCLNADGVGSKELEQYRDLLIADGFKTAGQYPSRSQLYKKIDGVCYCFDTEEPFAGGDRFLTGYFCIKEPYGGYDYKKPEEKKKGFKGFFGR